MIPDPHLWPARAILAVLSLATFDPPGARAAGADAPELVRQVVLDIVSYTRWPSPGPTLRLCVVGQAEQAAALLEPGLRAGTTPVAPTRMAATDDRMGTGCDVVYQGPLTPGEREAVGRRVAGHPVLTVGEPAPGCIEATMFCLALRDGQVSFASNLDAIARSGVRLNPRVLLLGRRAGGAR